MKTKGHYKHGSISNALDTTRQIVGSSFKLDITRYNSMILAPCKEGRVHEAQECQQRH
uniref:Uncharacterized protein n=1 Tax=Nelumbo nucifera TaxID=4432 RepID=A0A822Y553_NELNU|nr:TPA_asm: hypothetical protein HUJ06_028611 [Nelumbo nucifera]